LPEELEFVTAFEEMNKSILVKTTVILRIYILQLLNLSTRDLFSDSDPYVKILLGDKVLVNEKKKFFNDKKNCNWYQYYDLLVELPGSSKLTIQVMDYDPIFSDELIGETSIDIENRYFDPTWQSLENKPVETRTLYHPDYEESQGEVTMWLEMFDKNEQELMDVWNIAPQPESKLQCRLIIFETEGMENMDIEDTSDVYVTGFVNPKEKQSTDIHYRCQTGVASFNWRLLIPIHTPEDSYNLTIDVYDNDILVKDDFICGCRLNLSYLVNDVNTIDLPIKLTKDYYASLPQEKKVFSNIEFAGKEEDEEGAKFWVQLEKNGKKGGRVLCSLEIVPEWYAAAYPVGKGRDAPNVEPYLPPPIGRISFTLNPIKMLNQLTGPKFRKKICKFICIILLIIYLVFLIPYGIYFLFGELINPFNYTSKKSSSNKDKKQ
jgi:Ca2+-dependent lipid-binding protein